jgi:uncharacterized protein YjdB
LLRHDDFETAAFIRQEKRRRKMANNALKARGKRVVSMEEVPQPNNRHLGKAQLTLHQDNDSDDRAPRPIDILPKNPWVAAGLRQKFTATEAGVPADVYWESSDPTIAKIDPETGWATGLKVGSVAITATSERAVGSLVLNVTAAALQSISIAASSPSVALGLTTQFTATGTYSDGTTPDITNLVTWSSSRPGGATFNTPGSPGLATGTGVGSTNITAALGTVTSNPPPLALNVTPAVLQSISIAASNLSIAKGQQQPFTATGNYSDNTTPDITNLVTWSSSGPGNATFNTPGSPGLATGAGTGPTTITAALSGVTSNSLQLNVTAAVLQSISVTPASATIKPGQTQLFTVTGTYSDNSTSIVTSGVAWSSSMPGVVKIDNTGVATGVGFGSATITATAGGFTATASLSAPAPAVKSIAIVASSPSVGAGQTLQLTVTATYSDGSTQDLPANANTTWSSNAASSSAGVVTITSTGLVTGVSCGPVNITATYTDASSGNSFTSPQLVLNVAPNFPDLGAADTQAFANAKSRVNQLLTAFERRGNLSDAEIAQLKDGLELVTEFLNNNPSAPIPNFNAASKAGNSLTDLQQLGITFNTDRTNGLPIGTGSGKVNVIDDRFRAIGDYLYGPPPLVANGVSLEHDPGTFPFGNGPNPGGLTDDQTRIAAVYGYVQNSLAAAPPYRTDQTLVTQDDKNRRALFNQTVEAADSDYRTNGPLYLAALARLIQTSQTAQINVTDWAKVVGVLVSQGITASNPQINTWIDRALATAQNVGQDAPPSEINIDLPDLEQDVSNFEIMSGNIFALQPAYFAAMLEELKVFQVVEKLVELFQNGVLPVVRGDAGNLLFAYWKNAALRVSEAERRGFYARTLGFPGGDADSPNRDFKDLFMRFVSAVSSFVRQNTVDNLLRSNIPGAISQQQVRKSGRDLATNISSHGYGMAYPMATELQKEINDVMTILKNGEIQDAYGAKDMWQLVDQVAGLELGGAKNSVKYRTMASAGATVFAWLANKATQLASGSYVPILDVAQLQNAPTYSTKPTTNPSDYDLVGACDQWLAVTGTGEESVDKMAQPIEGPAMPSRPIQIPSIARDMLESVGVPAMAYSAGNGKSNVVQSNWRLK